MNAQIEHRTPGKLSICEEIVWMNQKWIVVADDTYSGRHPNVAYIKWDYILRNISTGKTEKVLATVLEGKITNLEIVQQSS